MSKMAPIVHLLDPKSIIIKRDERQREVFTTDDLKASIPIYGQLNPIIVKTDNQGNTELVAGERRLTTFLEMPSLGKIQAVFRDDLSPKQTYLVELEENIKRQDLAWTEFAKAVVKIHDMHKAEDDSWTIAKTGATIGYEENATFRIITVGREIIRGNEILESKEGWTSAYTLYETQQERKRENASAKLTQTLTEQFSEIDKEEEETQQPSSEVILPQVKNNEPVEEPVPILNEDSLKFMNDYQGVPFNFGHCDFPYGIDLQDSDQSHSESQGNYNDTQEIYWELLGTMLKNRNRLFSPSTHIMFWFSPKLYVETLEFFEHHAPDLWVQDIPLVWLKSDNAGILADPKRRPRNITEFAFLISRGDRKLVDNRAVSNGYAAPSSRVIHKSEKPVPVLRHFFRMLVDSNTRMLDPTSGSANSLVAALDFNPDTMLGIEIDSDFHSRSVAAFRKARTLKQLAGA